MLTNKNVKAVALVALVSSAATLEAAGQGLGNSPYSRLGIGETYSNSGGVRQMGMGGVGLAAPNSANVNDLNPALLYYTSRTNFEAGYVGQYKTVRNATASGHTGSGTLGYLALAVPLSRKWAAAVGLKPLSAVDYETNGTQSVTGDPTATSVTQNKGQGGVSEAYFGQGFQLTKALAIGATVSYQFGSVDETSSTTVVPANTTVSETVVDRLNTHYSDFGFRVGAHYRKKLGKDLNVNLAGVYSFKTRLGTEREGTQERRDLNGALTASTVSSTILGNTVVPALLQGGISFDNNKNWSANFDVAQQKWSEFSTLGALSSLPLSDTWRAGLGGELTPDPGSVEHYFQRVTYRAGVNLAQLPYRPDGKVLYDRSVSWGFAFPLPTATPLEATTFSLAFTYGIRGNTDVVSGGSNVQETYIKGQFGVTLNNRWFIKRRLQ